MSENCLFCKMISGEIPCDKVFETDKLLAFRDIAPKAPTHILVIPKEHIKSVVDFSDSDAHKALAGELLLAAQRVAKSENLNDNFRIVFNTGAEAGQTVFHAHMHVLGGRGMSWPPG